VKNRAGWLAAGLIAFALVVLLDTPLKHQGAGSRPAFAAAATLLMTIWWLTEAVPINVTAALPILLFPLFGVFEGDFATRLLKTLAPYVNPYIFLFMGGMCIAAAMQQWNLHRRIALHIMRRIGTNPQRLLLGFLAATAFISLWISNTATAAMMLPIGIAVISQCETKAGRRLEHYGAAIMLAIAYASNLGGIGTKIGTAPNAQFAAHMSTLGVEVTFLQFAAVGFPFVMVMLPLAWWLLWRVGRKDGDAADVGARAIDEELAKLGPIQRGEILVLAVFLATAAIWMAGQPLAQWLAIKPAYLEGGASMTAAILLMLLRAERRAVLGFASLKLQPWGALVLLGGSFAMAEGIQQSGLSAYVANVLTLLRDLAPFWQILLAAITTVALSAVASNVATIAVMLGVLTDAVSPAVVRTVLFTATIAASCDFALPAGTPPNAIVFASGYLTVRRMASTGVVLDVIAALVAAVWCAIIVPFVL
jgi:solute carrier family 13 (sodium-dependent dicarboxylate transporter), member 2/3/5